MFNNKEYHIEEYYIENNANKWLLTGQPYEQIKMKISLICIIYYHVKKHVSTLGKCFNPIKSSSVWVKHSYIYNSILYIWLLLYNYYNYFSCTNEDSKH